jgi:hypothetical protein
LSEAKHLWMSLTRCVTRESEILRFAQNDNKGCTEPLGPNSRAIDGYEAVTS